LLAEICGQTKNGTGKVEKAYALEVGPIFEMSFWLSYFTLTRLILAEYLFGNPLIEGNGQLPLK
jgi:hypothetical protein